MPGREEACGWERLQLSNELKDPADNPGLCHFQRNGPAGEGGEDEGETGWGAGSRPGLRHWEAEWQSHSVHGDAQPLPMFTAGQRPAPGQGHSLFPGSCCPALPHCTGSSPPHPHTQVASGLPPVLRLCTMLFPFLTLRLGAVSFRAFLMFHSAGTWSASSSDTFHRL